MPKIVYAHEIAQLAHALLISPASVVAGITEKQQRDFMFDVAEAIARNFDGITGDTQPADIPESDKLNLRYPCMAIYHDNDTPFNKSVWAAYDNDGWDEAGIQNGLTQLQAECIRIDREQMICHSLCCPSLPDESGTMQQVSANYVTGLTVTDPDTKLPVELAIYKCYQNGSMFGMDSSYIRTLSDDDLVFCPFSGDELILIEDQGQMYSQ